MGTFYQREETVYNPTKAAQLVAFFAMKSPEKRINHLKLAKLVYLADRENLERFGFPILDEQRVSMKYGPVNSSTLNMISGVTRDINGGWSKFVAEKVGNFVPLARADLTEDDLDELSEAELSTLEAVWEKFGQFSGGNLVNYTHNSDNVPEWEDPEVSGIGAKDIALESILTSVGVSAPAEHAAEIDSLNKAASFLKGL